MSETPKWRRTNRFCDYSVVCKRGRCLFARWSNSSELAEAVQRTETRSREWTRFVFVSLNSRQWPALQSAPVWVIADPGLFITFRFNTGFSERNASPYFVISNDKTMYVNVRTTNHVFNLCLRGSSTFACLRSNICFQT